MGYEQIVVLIPSHSLEDFPAESNEDESAGLLNAFAVAWHPVLVDAAGDVPGWDRSDEPPEFVEGKLFFAPSACEDWLPGGWIGHAEQSGATVVHGTIDREEMIGQALAGMESPPEVDPELVADFLALGTCWLQVELLTRHMHHFSNLDEAQLQREAVAAARAAVAADVSAAQSHLQTCFEVLFEARERFYPVDCYLIDLCLLIPELADANFEKVLDGGRPVNVLLSAADFEQIAGEKPELVEKIRAAWEGGGLDLVGGDYHEAATPLVPVETTLRELERGHGVLKDLSGRTPVTWGRRRYGLCTLLPQILARHGYEAALHLVLDDGLYPDDEQSKMRWEGCDGTLIDAITRIPLAADSALSYLRFPVRMAESMEQDQVAALVLARWPEVKAPWFTDFERIHRYAPVLGRFVAIREFVQDTDSPGRLSSHEEREYLSPFLVQAVARREANPVTRFRDHFLRRHRFDAAAWCRSMADVLLGRRCTESVPEDAIRTIEDAGPDGSEEQSAAADEFLQEWTTGSAGRLGEVILAGGSDRPGCLVVNPLSFPRRVCVTLPDGSPAPPLTQPVRAVQSDGQRHTAVVDVPGCGFAWFPLEGGAAAEESPALAEENILRNDYFEVHVNPETGGIQRIKGFGRKPNRLSQQLAFRFPRERTLPARDDEPPERSWYSEMRCRSLEVTCDGPALGEIVTSGDIVDQANEQALAGFRQTVRVWRGRPFVEVDVELDVHRAPEGSPWNDYYAARFAWNDSTATLTRSVMQGAHGYRGERIESPHYLEIASDEERTTILPGGLAFHRKTGPRMLDTILVAEGETRRKFSFVVAVDVAYPLQAALDAMVPPLVLPSAAGPPKSGDRGWLLHLDARNVQLTRILDLVEPPASPSPSESENESETETEPHGDAGPTEPLPPHGFAVRLMETEGRARRVLLRAFRTPAFARQRDFTGATIATLPVEGDGVRLDLSPYEIADVELRFDA